MVPENLDLLFTEEEVEKAIIRMGHEILNGNPDLCFVMILKGGVYVGMKLLEYLDRDIPYGYIGLNTYSGASTQPSKSVYCTYKPMFEPDFLRGKNIIVVDDVVESGLTLKRAKKLLRQFSPQSIHTCVLVDKSDPGLYESDIRGFVYEGRKFIVGCGMGLGEQYRSLKCVCEVRRC
jgi:hypoxanthine phosphoribosyltransferase